MLKKIILVFFLIGLLAITLIEVNTNIQQIRLHSIENQPKEINVSGKHTLATVKSDISTDEYTRNKMMERYSSEQYRSPWSAIERRISYNNELQLYSKDNVVIKGDMIEIISKKEQKEDKGYTSGLVESNRAYMYGYYEFTIEVGEGRGIFPAIWFLPSEGKNVLPEIDVFEMIGSEPLLFYGVIHYLEGGIRKKEYFENKVLKQDQYKVALDWTPETLSWFIDDEKVYSTYVGVPQEYMYITVNQAIGGDWPGNPDDSIFPVEFKIVSSKIDPVYSKGR